MSEPQETGGRRRWRGGKRRRTKGQRLLFATDVHGSERCFRKFLNAAPLYRIKYLILGGDMTGKTVVPLVRHRDGSYECVFGGTTHSGLDEKAATELRARIRGFGQYTVTVDEGDVEALRSEERRNELFSDAVRKSVEDWVTLAEERLRGTGIRCFMAPGNDDFFVIDSALEASDVVEFAENRLLELDDEHEMITTGYSNQTPWDTERELSESDLRDRIDGMARGARRPENLIAVLHAPPYRSGIDDAPALNDQLEMTVNAGGVKMAPVGSTAVRGFIEDSQPLLGLHGHVHEGRGAAMIGRTLCLNPGSNYTEGMLSAVMVEFADGEVIDYQFVNG
jgi:Icc-related predicted phosphoesterase